MLEMRPGRPEEVPAQKALWKAAFGDEDRYIDWFYECCGGSADVLEVVEEGRLASMLALLPQTLTLPGGGTASGWYIYALATDPGARSKGYGRQLLRFVDGYLAERGADCVTTVPAEPSLFKFFGTVGFAPCFSTRKLELLKSMLQPAAEGDRAEPVEPGEYNAICLRGWNRKMVEAAAVAAGGSCSFWSSFGSYIFPVPGTGQGNSRTAAAEATKDYLEAHGYDAGVYYQID